MIGSVFYSMPGKYHFEKLEVDEVKEIEGRYKYILSSALNYARRHEIKFEVTNLGKVSEFSSDSRVMIKRIK